MIEQDKFTYSLLAKALEKQTKIYEAQGKNMLISTVIAYYLKKKRKYSKNLLKRFLRIQKKNTS